MAREAHSQTKSRDPPDRELGQGPESGSVTLATGRSSVTVQDPHRVCRTDRPHREPGCEKRESPRVSGGEAGPPRPLPIPAFPGEREGGCAGTCTVRHWSKQPLRERAPATSPRPWVVVLLEFLTCCYTRIPRSRDSSFCYFLLKKQRHVTYRERYVRSGVTKRTDAHLPPPAAQAAKPSPARVPFWLDVDSLANGFWFLEPPNLPS